MWTPPQLTTCPVPFPVVPDGNGAACDAVVVTDADLARRVRDCCRLTGSFVLRSGREVNEYFDKYQFEADPALLGEIADALVRPAEGAEVRGWRVLVIEDVVTSGGQIVISVG